MSVDIFLMGYAEYEAAVITHVAFSYRQITTRSP